MSSHHYSHHAPHHAPLGCLNEHLNYFSENVASGHELDDIFSKDFDLVFDPVLLMSEEATVARPVDLDRASQPAPTPMAVTSYSMPVQSRSFVPAPVIKEPVRKPVAPEVSPTSVTAVFESIPVAPSKSSPRKRSYSMVSAKPEPAHVISTDAPVDTSNMSFQEQEDLRRERNRHHAKKSRQRKRDYMNQLEDAVNDMRKENDRLFDLLGMDSRKAKADMAAEEDRRAALATEKFIAGLKQPRNRVLDNTTLAFLRELWK